MSADQHHRHPWSLFRHTGTRKCVPSSLWNGPLCLLSPQVFVEYANAGDSKAAQKLLTGRMFDGKFVVATFYPLSAYKRGYLYQTLL